MKWQSEHPIRNSCIYHVASDRTHFGNSEGCRAGRQRDRRGSAQRRSLSDPTLYRFWCKHWGRVGQICRRRFAENVQSSASFGRQDGFTAAIDKSVSIHMMMQLHDDDNVLGSPKPREHWEEIQGHKCIVGCGVNFTLGNGGR